MVETRPERIGRYAVLAELGRGAMGVVYKARDPQLDRVVAIKTVRRDLGLPPEQDGELRRRVYQEATAAGRLNHPHIVAIHDVLDLDEVPYIVMEYVEGRTLADMIAAEGPLPPLEAVGLMTEVCGALEYAHASGVIHRDIKPGNILVTPGGVAKVSDFGIARIAGSHVTRTGAFLGTPAYMSPEQLRGRALDGRSDVFALGVTLYEALTGVPPFRGEDLTAVLYQIVHGAPVPLSEQNPAVPRSLEPVTERAMAKDPEARYATARGFAEALTQAMTAQAGPGPTVLSRPVKPEPRRPRSQVRGVLVGVACLTFASVGGWAVWTRWSPERPVLASRPSPQVDQPFGPAAAASPIDSDRSASPEMRSTPPARVPSTASRPSKPAEEPTPPPAERQTPALGSIRIATDPSVDVFLDGEFRGRTESGPLVVPKVSPGERMVTLRLGSREQTLHTTVNGGQTATLTYHFPPAPAEVSVESLREALGKKGREGLGKLREGVDKAQREALGAVRDVLEKVDGDRERRGRDRERSSERR